jgi:hypothetical protein
VVRCVCEPSKSFGPAKILRSGPSSPGLFYRKKKDIANGSLGAICGVRAANKDAGFVKSIKVFTPGESSI